MKIYTEKYLSNISFKKWLNRWGLVVIILIFLNWFWPGLPEQGAPTWLVLLENLNVGLFLMTISTVHRHALLRAVIFVMGFLTFVMFCAKVGDML
jgi:hypothetical protein